MIIVVLFLIVILGSVYLSWEPLKRFFSELDKIEKVHIHEWRPTEKWGGYGQNIVECRCSKCGEIRYFKRAYRR